MSLSDMSYGSLDFSYDVIEKVGDDVAASIIQRLQAPAAKKGDIAMLVDGGATSVIVQDRTKLINLRAANIAIKVGGGVLHCKWVGDYYWAARANGKFIVNHAVARCMPGFGFDILPESIYLAAGAKLLKDSSKVEAIRGNDILMTADKHPHCWLYFAQVTPISKPPEGTKMLSPFTPLKNSNAAAAQQIVAAQQECSDSASFALGYAHPSFIEVAHITIGGVTCEGANTSISANFADKSAEKDFSTTETISSVKNAGTETSLVARSQTISSDDLLIQHRKHGHRNYEDVCRLLGIPLPTKLPVCTTCIQAKSKRHPLRRRDTPPSTILNSRPPTIP